MADSAQAFAESVLDLLARTPAERRARWRSQ
jgi:hypothetical protein